MTISRKNPEIFGDKKMIRDIKRKYFEVWGNEEAQNVFLKGVLMVLGSLFLIQSVAFTVVCLRKPELIAIGSKETKVFTITEPPEELLMSELKRCLRRYLELHYTWDADSATKNQKEASRYVGSSYVKAFNQVMAEQTRVAKEKKLSQKAYVSELLIDSKKLSAKVTLDRILSVDGLRAATPLLLEISFEYGPRSEMNPEGVYITGEKLLNSQTN
jgi:hypothetical protein